MAYQRVEKGWSWVLSHRWNTYINLLHSSFIDHHRSGESIRVRGSIQVLWDAFIWPWQGCCIPSSLGKWFCTRCSIDRRRTCKDPHLAEELVTVRDCWVKENHYSLGTWPLIGCHSPVVCPHSCLHMGSTNCPQWLIFKRKVMEFEGRCVRDILGNWKEGTSS